MLAVNGCNTRRNFIGPVNLPARFSIARFRWLTMPARMSSTAISLESGAKMRCEWHESVGVVIEHDLAVGWLHLCRTGDLTSPVALRVEAKLHNGQLIARSRFLRRSEKEQRTVSNEQQSTSLLV